MDNIGGRIDLSLLKLQPSITYKFMDDYWIDVRVPPKYSQFPENLNIQLHSRYEFFTQDLIQEYFDDLVNCNYRVHTINGIRLSGDTRIRCDYCRTETGIKYYYCLQCHKDMCELCYGETSEEIALKNGAKNYAKRKDSLVLCQKSHHLVNRATVGYGTYCCNMCDGECISWDVEKNLGIYSNRELDYDLCLECGKTEEGKNLIGEKTLVQTDYTMLPVYTCSFGSLLDWVPILKDYGEDHMILYNLNPASPYYRKVALCCFDDHGRMGYFTISDGSTLQTIIDEANKTATELEIKQQQEEEKEKDDDLEDPIKLMMRTRGIPTYYG